MRRTFFHVWHAFALIGGARLMALTWDRIWSTFNWLEASFITVSMALLFTLCLDDWTSGGRSR